MKKILLLSLMFILGAVASASALTIDFTDDAWAAAEGLTEYTFTDYDGDLDITLKAIPTTRTLSYQNDGIGIDGWGGQDDEIDDFEWLLVSFDPDVIVNSLSFYDAEKNETVKYILEGSCLVFADKGSEGTEELFTVETGSEDFVTWIKISATGTFGLDNVALAQMDVTTPSAPVPEPATMILLGSGLLGFAVRRKKK